MKEPRANTIGGINNFSKTYEYKYYGAPSPLLAHSVGLLKEATHEWTLVRNKGQCLIGQGGSPLRPNPVINKGESTSKKGVSEEIRKKKIAAKK